MKNTRKKERTIKTEAERTADLMEDSWSWRRLAMQAAMFAAGIGEALLCAWIKKLPLGDMLAVMFTGILFSVLFLMELERYRLKKGWFHEKANNYVRIALAYSGCCLAGVLFLFLPGYARPVLLFGGCMALAAKPFLGMLAGLFQLVILVLCGEGSVYLLLCGILLVCCGCIIVSFLQEAGARSWAAATVGSFSFGCVVIFSYLETSQVNRNVVSYGLCNGVFSVLGMLLVYPWLAERMNHTREQELHKIIAKDFPLVRDVESYSKADYEHARKVSGIAGNCAAMLGVNADVAAAAGFYYRIGRMEGEPYVENGVKLAKGNYFPMEVVQILSEYNGEKNLPSTVESAVVHIVDSVVAKFDVLDKNTLSSSWNQDILVYQTLNENSALGLYDKAGFSMNMFLKIRDYLIKEAKLS